MAPVPFVRLVLLFLVVLVPFSAAAGPRLVMGPFKAHSLKAELQEFLPEHLAQQLVSRGVDTVSQRDLATAIGLERQKQLLGCGDSACSAELMGALGVDGIVVGEVADLDGVLVVNLKIISANAAKPLATYSTRVTKRAQLADALEAGAVELAKQVKAVVPPKAAAVTVTPPPVEPEPRAQPQPQPVEQPQTQPQVQVTAPVVLESSKTPAFIAAGAAVALLGAGAVLSVLASADHGALTTKQGLSVDEALRLANQGASFQALSIVGFATGGAAALTSIILFLVHAPPPVQVSLAVAPGAGALVFGGSFP